jgi:hypothetical protein
MYSRPQTQWYEFGAVANQPSPGAVVAGDVWQDRWPGCGLLLLRASLIVASTLGDVEIDLLVNSVSILSTPLTIDVNTLTSVGSATPYVIINGVIPDDAEILWEVLSAGANATGLTIRALVSN